MHWRRLLFRAAIGVLLATLVLVILTGGYLLFERWSGQARLRTVRAELTKEGILLPLDTIAPTPPAKELERGTRLIAAIEGLKGLSTERRVVLEGPTMMQIVAPGKALSTAMSPAPIFGPPTESMPAVTWEELQTHVEAGETILAEARALLQEPTAFRYNHGEFGEVSTIGESQKLLAWLRLSALLRLREGNIPGAIDDLIAIDQLSEVIGGASSLVRHVLRVGFWTFGVRGMLWETLQNPDPTDADLARMDELVNNCDFLTNALKAIQIEIAVQDAAYRYLKTAPESGLTFWASDSESILDTEPVVAIHDFLWPSIWAVGDEARSLEWWSDGYKKGCELLASRDWTSIRNSWDDGESSSYDLWRFPFAENTARSHAVRSFLRAVIRAEVSRELLLAAIALERYQRRNGDYPEELQLLVPDFLKDLPHDWFDGRPLKYRRLDPESFLLYSVGQDGTDDGGDPSPAKSDAPPSFDSGKDLIWPVRNESSSDNAEAAFDVSFAPVRDCLVC